jgi:hypothetical protein
MHHVLQKTKKKRGKKSGAMRKLSINLSQSDNYWMDSIIYSKLPSPHCHTVPPFRTLKV